MKLVPGIFGGMGLILLLVSIAMQLSFASFGDVWIDYARGFGLTILMACGILGALLFMLALT